MYKCILHFCVAIKKIRNVETIQSSDNDIVCKYSTMENEMFVITSRFCLSFFTAVNLINIFYYKYYSLSNLSFWQNHKDIKRKEKEKDF